MKPFEIMIDGRPVRTFAEKRKGILWFHYKGQTYSVDLKPVSTKQKGASAAGDEIAAPMPGKILKVSAKEGQEVKARQTLVVMEAMKMEYALTAPADGIVESVRCSEGDQVSLGAVLVKLKLSSGT